MFYYLHLKIGWAAIGYRTKPHFFRPSLVTQKNTYKIRRTLYQMAKSARIISPPQIKDFSNSYYFVKIQTPEKVLVLTPSLSSREFRDFFCMQFRQ